MNDSFFSNLRVQTAKDIDNSNSSYAGEVVNKKDDFKTQAGSLNERDDSYNDKNPYSNESIKKNSFWNCFSTGIKFKKKPNKH